MVERDLPEAVMNLRRIWHEKKYELKLTQAKAAEQLGWTQGAVSQYLNNLTELNPAAVIKLANFLGVHPLEIDPSMGPSLPRQGYALSAVSNTQGEALEGVRHFCSADEDLAVIEASEDVEGAHPVPKGARFVCLKKGDTSAAGERNGRGLEPIYLILRKGSDKMETVFGRDLPSRKELKKSWRVVSINFY